MKFAYLISQLDDNSKKDEFEYIQNYNHCTFIIMPVKFYLKIVLPLAINLLWREWKDIQFVLSKGCIKYNKIE